VVRYCSILFSSAKTLRPTSAAWRWAEAQWETLEKVKKWLKNSDAELDPKTLATFKAFYSRRLNEVGLGFTNSEAID